MQKKYLVTCVALAITASVLFFQNTKERFLEMTTAKPSDVIKSPQKQTTKSISAAKLAEKTTIAKSPAAPAEDDTLFPHYKLLNSEELEKFKVVPEQIVKYFDWGKMDDDQIEAFRQIMWDFGDRAIATLANELNKVSSAKEKIDNKRAKEMISYVDFLRYLSQSPGQKPLAKQAVEKLATRPIIWENDGKPNDPQKAGITLECFQIYSAIKTEAAEQFISELDNQKKPPYIYNYIVGLKLGKVHQETSIARAKEVFGDILVLKALQDEEKT